MTFISPRFTTETFGPYPTLDQKILIFEDRELGWRFNIAEVVEKNSPAGGYAIISILFAYFEMVYQYSTGLSSKNGPGDAFRNGVRLVYPARTFTDEQLKMVYDRVRCGMFHNGYTKFGTLISGGFSALAIDNDTVLVNPHQLRADLLTHFRQYVATLKDVTNATARTKFEMIFDAGFNWSCSKEGAEK